MSERTCERPECNNTLNTGSSYCSTSCSAKDRRRKRALKKNNMPIMVREVIPPSVSRLFVDKFGEEAIPMLDEMAVVMLEQSMPAPPLAGRTEGDFTSTYYLAGQDRRPNDALDHDLIAEMLKSGLVLFVMEMKIAALMTPWRNEQSWKIICPDKKLAEIAEANERRNLARMMLDIYRSALAYGVYFGEKEFEYKNAYQLGLSQSRGSSAEFAVPKIPNACNPTSIDRIERTKDSKQRFNGFVQIPRHSFPKQEIHVSRDQALVVPHKGQFRNLWGESFLKPIYPVWFWYEVALRSWVRFMERMGTPVAVCYAPSKAKVLKPGTTTLVDAMTWGLAMAGNIAKSNAAVMPSDHHPETHQPLWRLEYMNSEDRGDVFHKALEFLTQAAVRAAMSADRATTQASGGIGSYSIGEIHNAATQYHNELIAIETVAYLNQYYYPDYSLYNRGANGPPIWIVSEGLDPMEKDRLFKLFNIGGNSANFQEALMMIDWRTMYDMNNVPTLTDEKVQEIKKRLEKEALDKQKKFTEIQSKAKQPFPPGKFGQDANKPNVIKEPKPEEENDKKLQNMAYMIVDGSYVPIILSGHEMNMLMNVRSQGADVAFDTGGNEETIKLFNPFHDPKSGRFASKKGGGGATIEEGSVGGAATGKAAGAAAGGGRLHISTGGALGLAVLGAVALAVAVPAVASAMPLDEASEEEQQETLDKVENWRGDERERTEELLKNRKKYKNVDEAVDDILKTFEEVGITDVQPGVEVKFKRLDNMFAAAMYDTDTNVLTINPEFRKYILAGDPMALEILAHELAHSSQEVHRTMTPSEIDFARQSAKLQGMTLKEYMAKWGDGVVPGGNRDEERSFIHAVEGQNDLVALMVISKMTGVAADPVALGRAHEALTGEEPKYASADENYLGKVGYPTDVARTAAMLEIARRNTGVDPAKNIAEIHNNSLDYYYQVRLLRSIFPEQMADYQGYKNEYDLPGAYEINKWMEEDYDMSWFNDWALAGSPHSDINDFDQWDYVLDMLEDAANG